ncbi:MAG: hypothetical protein IKP71_08840 [Candidatus Riflebacteria bacterium]|nr:hypothetical protein [Candidatus Riflebacteria bacterium]
MKYSINNAIPNDKEIEVGELKIKVKQFLSTEEKKNLLEMVMQRADGGTVMTDLITSAVFEVYLILKYTDLEISDEDKADILTLYDSLEKDGVIEGVISAMPAKDYEELLELLSNMVDDYTVYRNSARGFIDKFLAFAPDATDKFNKALESLDLDKMENVVSIAKGSGLK